MNARITTLQQQVETLFNSLNALRSDIGGPNIDPILRNAYDPRQYSGSQTLGFRSPSHMYSL